MLYQIKRLRLMAALKVGLFGGLALGLFSGLILPSVLVGIDIFIRFNSLGNISGSPNFLPLFVQLTISLALIGAIGGAITGAIIMLGLGSIYNLLVPYTGGLLVELEPRGKLKAKNADVIDEQQEASVAPPLLADELLTEPADLQPADLLHRSINRL
jgi:hypothetical protein